MMKTKINVTFTTEITDNNRQERLSFESSGILYEKNDSTYIKFTEQHDEGEVSTTLKIKAEEVRIIRSGLVSMNHLYRNLATTEGKYESPLGSMAMETKTDKFSFQWERGKGRLFLSYTLRIQGQEAGRYDITLFFTA